MKQITGNLDFLLENPQRLTGINGRLSFALRCGVGRQGFLELGCDADVIDHQTAWFVLEHPVDAGNRLGQVRPLHRFIHIHCRQTGSIKSCQPHIPNDDDLERVGRILEPLLQILLLLFGGVVGLEVLRIRCRCRHHHLDCTFLGVVIVPIRAQSNDGVIEASTDVPAHRHHHRLARLGA